MHSTIKVIVSHVDNRSMPEVPTTYTLERLYHRIAELEADLRLVNANIEYLERVVLGKQPAGALGEPKDNWKEIA